MWNWRRESRRLLGVRGEKAIAADYRALAVFQHLYLFSISMSLERSQTLHLSLFNFHRSLL